MEDLTGRQFGPYQIVGPLGEGGMAAVYKAYQPAIERYVALKVLPRPFAKDPEFVSRFQREARVLAQLQHPHILPVFDFGEHDGYAYLVMPFVAGGTLTQLLKGGPPAWPRLRQIVAQIGDALDYAHAHSLVHRDIKPSNVLIDERGNCLLSDFGLAKIVAGQSHLTTSGALLGTPAYMSPEQGSGQSLDARSDIYSLGVILYELATGRVPYKAETPVAVIFKHIQDPLPPARGLNPDLPEAVERVILKALAKTPEDRYQTAGEMVRAIQAAIPDAAATPAEAAPRAPALAAARPLPPPFWQTVGLTALAWLVGTGLGLPFAAASLALAVAVAGAVGGLGLGWAWRRADPAVTRRRWLQLAGLWAASAGLGMLGGSLFFAAMAAAGYVTGRWLRQSEPAISDRQVAGMALGWALAWLVGGLLFSLATQVTFQALSGLLVIVSLTTAGVIGGVVTFRPLYRARSAGAPIPPHPR